MKQIIFITIFVWSFCFVGLAQSDTCPKIKINAPEYIQAGNTSKAFATFENEKQPSTSKFNWIVIKENEVFRINESGIIEVQASSLNEFGTIILLAQSLDQKCSNIGLKTVSIIPNVGHPITIDLYVDLSWSDEKFRLDLIANIFRRGTSDSDSETIKLFIYLEHKKKTSKVEVKNRLVRILNHLSKNNGLAKEKIVFVISQGEFNTAEFKPLPASMEQTTCKFSSEDCFIIRGEDFEKLENLFQTKPTTKKRKN